MLLLGQRKSGGVILGLPERLPLKLEGYRSNTHRGTYWPAFLTSTSRFLQSGSNWWRSFQNPSEWFNSLIWQSSCENTCRTRCFGRKSKLRFMLMFPDLEQLAQRVVCPLTVAF